MDAFGVLLALLRDRTGFVREIHDGDRVNQKIAGLLVCSALFLAIYGGLIGAAASWMQVLASAAKLPFLYLITLAICLPALYFFNVYFGSKITASQYAAYLLSAVAITATLLLGFAPITLFFLITTDSYQFFVLLNVGIFMLTGLIGVSFLYQVMRPLADDSDTNREIRTNLLKFWLGLYGFVGSQMAWTLRPFFGRVTDSFELFRPREGNFYISIFKTLKVLLFEQSLTMNSTS